MARKSFRFTMGPFTIRQRWVPEKQLDAVNAYALFFRDSREIHLSEVTDFERTVENLIHELIEAADAFGALRLPHNKIQILGLLLAQALKPIIKQWW